MSSNQLNITDLGLISINRKIINDRKFSENLISVKGDLPLRDGLASDFAKGSYLYKENLLLYGNRISLCIDGIFFSSKQNHNQVAWYLSGTDNPIIFQFVNDYPQVVLPTGETIDFNHLPFTDEMYFKAFVVLTNNSCKVSINTYNDVFTEERTLSQELNFSNYTDIYIGNNPTKTESDENYFWEGSLNIADFLISNEDVTFFSPTTGYSLKFNYIVISDGTSKLPTSTPRSIVRHLYHYPINQDQITRSDNTLLLTTQLDGNAKLVIREIGLYAESNGETFLFGYMKGLNINKSSEVPYDLFLTINLMLNVVNVVGFPDINSFIFNQVKPVLLKDFIKVRDANIYVTENLERMIRMNSLQPVPMHGYCTRIYDTETGLPNYISIDTEKDPSYTYDIENCCDNPVSIQSIGYNTPQVAYRVQKRIDEQQDCYSSVQTYAKMYNKIKKITGDVFNLDSVNGDGISKDGIFTDFTDIDASATTITTLSSNFEINTSFTINKFASHDRYLISLLDIDYIDEGGSKISSVTPYFDIYIDTENRLYFTHPGLSSPILLLSNVNLNRKYFVKINYDSSEPSSLVVSISTDGKNYNISETITNIPVTNVTEFNMFIGVKCSWTKPVIQEGVILSGGFAFEDYFTLGTINLNEWNILQEDNNWITYTNEVLKDSELIQYYHLPDYSKWSYTIHDICNPEYTISFLGGMTEGNGDLIDFNKSTSLCIKVNLKDKTPKLLLSKKGANSEELFNLNLTRTSIVSETGDESAIYSITWSMPIKPLYAWSYTSPEGETQIIYTQEDPIASTETRLYNSDLSLATQSPLSFNIVDDNGTPTLRYRRYLYAWKCEYNNEVIYTDTETITANTILYNESLGIEEQGVDNFEVVEDGGNYTIKFVEGYVLYAWTYENHIIYTKENPIESSEAKLYNENGAEVTPSDEGFHIDNDELVVKYGPNLAEYTEGRNKEAYPTIRDLEKDISDTVVRSTSSDPTPLVTFGFSITEGNIDEYLSNPFLISILRSDSVLYMYKNNELVASTPLEVELPTYEGSYLTNYTGDFLTLYAWTYTPEGASEPKIIYTKGYPISGVTPFYNRELQLVPYKNDEFHLESKGDTVILKYGEHDAEYSEEYNLTYANTGRYIKEIIVTNGVLTKDELYYVTNLLDTNFKFTNVLPVQDIPEE